MAYFREKKLIMWVTKFQLRSLHRFLKETRILHKFLRESRGAIVGVEGSATLLVWLRGPNS